MPRIQITQQDKLRGKLVTPNWYQLLVKETRTTAASTDGSDFHLIEMIVEKNKDFDGVPVTLGVSENLILAPAIELLVACGWNEKDTSADFADCVGKRIEGYIQRGSNYKTGAPENQPVSFRKIKQSTS